MQFLALQDLPYMNACIDEALRIFPPVPTGLTRTVPRGGDTVAGEFLPGGTPSPSTAGPPPTRPATGRGPTIFCPSGGSAATATATGTAGPPTGRPPLRATPGTRARPSRSARAAASAST
ncbi:isotrichodermin C-15 hydroxylase [Verticillium alfalfae VaMs.102]|uniref:Isotrichodermin C-15 hydroxylase n=1 Tax=Verticillium alfalfae (strain VaMs.102 / ATCC MYA-4576 / FGSC 10136) TaxID=526221 RepID=C9SQ29_VERA1|nr:isotrichodermin C-15 hydroxylase [Verticillium alfalfae VaMs.102]EEY20954.1 isotrichodermin C-15 hydroxylase [Verticillium alfalfae VaMs.102]